MNQSHASRSASLPEPEPRNAPSGTLALLEDEIAVLREANAHLQRRLAETELRAELRVTALRILAIQPPGCE